MAKYQIILESDAYFPDDDFAAIINNFIAAQDTTFYNVKVLEARNLEGIKKELWEKRDELKDNITVSNRNAEDMNLIVEESFEEIKDLFKLD